MQHFQLTEPAKTISNLNVEVRLIPLDRLRRSEEINIGRMQSLTNRIARCGEWTRPLFVEENSLVIMDGHHRFAAAQVLGLKHVPCALLSYGDARLSVVYWAGGSPFDSGAVIDAGLSGRLLGFKTTRHSFAGEIPCDPVQLKVLK